MSFRDHDPRTPTPRFEDDGASSSSDSIRAINQRPLENPDNIHTDAPEERFRLGYLDVVCLILNRMIGSGIFMVPMKLMAGTNSPGVVLLFWFAGILYALAGMYVYIEYGLSVPRYFYRGVETSAPRSGGELNYLQYVYRWLGYRGGLVLPIACIFGAAFLAFGNMTGNALNFGIWITRAAGNYSASDSTIRGIAIAAAFVSCFIHSISRRGGIFLNNILAITKALVLLLIVVTGAIVWAGGMPKTTSVIGQNTSPRTAFDGASTDAHGYADAFLAIIFTFSGFEQPNYVLGEIDRPRKRFPIAMVVGVSLTSVLYMLVNIAYMVVVPKEDQATHNVAQRFFELTYGQIAEPGNDTGYRVFSGFVAVSSLGNIIVMTYTAARVKQEIAKQGILPWPRFFARNRDISLGRLLRWLRARGGWPALLRRPWLAPEAHSEPTPAGALLLHCLSCLVLVGATSGLPVADAYALLTTEGAYLMNGFVGTLLGLGILLLRFSPGGPPQTPGAPRSTWTEMTRPAIKPALSVAAALVYMLGNAYPLVVTWIPPSRAFTGSLSWFVVPAVGWVTLALGGAWYLGFLAFAGRRRRKHGLLFSVERRPEFESADGGVLGGAPGPDGLIMAHETVCLAWVAEENLEKDGDEEEDPGFHQRRVSDPWPPRPGQYYREGDAGPRY